MPPVLYRRTANRGQPGAHRTYAPPLQPFLRAIRVSRNLRGLNAALAIPHFHQSGQGRYAPTDEDRNPPPVLHLYRDLFLRDGTPPNRRSALRYAASATRFIPANSESWTARGASNVCAAATTFPKSHSGFQEFARAERSPLFLLAMSLLIFGQGNKEAFRGPHYERFNRTSLMTNPLNPAQADRSFHVPAA